MTSPSNPRCRDAVRKEDLPSLNYLFCNFALQEVGQFIRELFPPFYQFPFEIDNSTKLTDYLLAGIGYSFLPTGLVQPLIEAGSLCVVRLLDFEAPRINCYECFLRGRSGAAALILQQAEHSHSACPFSQLHPQFVVPLSKAGLKA